MLVHSFSTTHRWFDDFAAFSRVLQMPLDQPNQGSVARVFDGISLRLAWVSDMPQSELSVSEHLNRERTSRYIFQAEVMLFPRSLRSLSVQFDARISSDKRCNVYREVRS